MNNNTCQICCELFTPMVRLKIICQKCNFEACKNCIKSYLLTTIKDPHCMKCQMPYDYKYLINQFSYNWVSKIYKNHRKNLLLDRELCQVPATMNLANTTIKIQNIDSEIKQIVQKKKELLKQLYELKNKEAILNSKKRELQTGKVDNAKQKFIMACPSENCRGFLSQNYLSQLISFQGSASQKFYEYLNNDSL